MRTTAAGVPENTGHNPHGLFFITQRLDQDKAILSPLRPATGTSGPRPPSAARRADGLDFQPRQKRPEHTRALPAEVANTALFCYLQGSRTLFLWERHPAAKIVAGSHSHRKANFVIDVGWHNTHSPAFYEAVKNTDFLIVHHP
ncbi:MAG: hypothetical protein Q7U75_11170, partial [Desulfobacterales bacterium]|nr:hypothetical protein [Desulfobacterales bacterium]